jgi:hypothetical protein
MAHVGGSVILGAAETGPEAKVSAVHAQFGCCSAY